MAFGRKKPSSESSSPGLKRELGELLEEASSHARVRGELFTIEAKEAAEIYGRKFGISIAALAFLLTGYLLGLAATVGLLGSLFSGSGFSLANWTGASFLIAAIHFIVGVLLLKKGKQTGQNFPAFEYTRNEFKKDQQWIKEERKR